MLMDSSTFSLNDFRYNFQYDAQKPAVIDHFKSPTYILVSACVYMCVCAIQIYNEYAD